MEVLLTEKPSKHSGKHPFTAKRLTGRLYELCAATFLRRSGIRILKKNLWFGPGEVDLLGICKKTGRLGIFEVRGVAGDAYPPSLFLSFRKRTRLRLLSELVVQRYKRNVCVELVEIIGKPPRWALAFPKVAAYFPKTLGLKIRRVPL